jgi:S-adenosylhomocysteine hydrolase
VSTEAFLERIHPFTKNILIEAARANPVAKPLSRLPLLDWFAKVHAVQPQKDIVIVYHSHILHSSLELIKHLAYIAGPENTFVLEKPYSTLHQAFSKAAEGGVKTYQMKIDRSMSYEYSVKRNVDFFWREIQEYVRVNQTKEIIVISDGADVLLSPVIRELQDIKIIGIEQTQRGLSRLQKANLFFPVVSIAQTKSKKNYESPFIAAAALAKIDAASLLNRTYRYGIVGAGSIGKEIIRGLNLHGITPLVYDPIKTSSLDDFQAQSLEYLVQNSDIIIGTTGTDSLRGMYIERIKGKKIFISTSSSNVEFDYLFDLAKTYANSFEDIRLRISSTFSAIVLNGGYPINFDREVEWESFNDIQLTRALIYASVYEAINRKSTKAKIKCLHNALEKEVTNKWLLLR